MEVDTRIIWRSRRRGGFIVSQMSEFLRSYIHTYIYIYIYIYILKYIDIVL